MFERSYRHDKSSLAEPLQFVIKTTNTSKSPTELCQDAVLSIFAICSVFLCVLMVLCMFSYLKPLNQNKDKTQNGVLAPLWSPRSPRKTPGSSNNHRFPWFPGGIFDGNWMHKHFFLLPLFSNAHLHFFKSVRKSYLETCLGTINRFDCSSTTNKP